MSVVFLSKGLKHIKFITNFNECENIITKLKFEFIDFVLHPLAKCRIY